MVGMLHLRQLEEQSSRVIGGGSESVHQCLGSGKLIVLRPLGGMDCLCSRNTETFDFRKELFL